MKMINPIYRKYNLRESETIIFKYDYCISKIPKNMHVIHTSSIDKTGKDMKLW
jgi:hypothetical protein